MRRIDIQLLLMLSTSMAALCLMVGLVFWPSNVAAILSPAESGLQINPIVAPSGWDGTLFADVTEASLVDFRHDAGAELRDIRQVMAPGLCAADFNGDGAVDLFLPGSGRTPDAENAIFLNIGGFQFRRLSEPGIPAAGENAMGCVAADVDNDDDVDLYVTALGANRLYMNDGSGRFEERAADAGVADPRWSAGAAWADFDRDGLLDLYVANYLRFSEEQAEAYAAIPSDRDEPTAFSPYVFEAEDDALYRNRGDGTFEDVTIEVGVSGRPGKGMAVAFTDIDDDGWAELVVINDVSPNRYFDNVEGRFVDAGLLSGLADPRSGMGVAVGDYDGDGLLDLFSSHWQDESNVLYRNFGSSKPGETAFFDDVTIAARLGGPSIGLTGWGSVFGDFDLDGDLDLLVVNGYTSPSASDRSQCIGQPPLLAMQVGNHSGRFELRKTDSGLDSLNRLASRGAVAADFDGDGDLDLAVTTNNGPVRLFENRQKGGRFLKVRPLGQAVGCNVTVRLGKTIQRRTILAGTSYLSSEPLEAHFGLGDAAEVDELVIRWADGATARRMGVMVNQTLQIGPD